MKLKPHLTEKAITLAKTQGIYTFIGPVTYTKDKVKQLFKDIFGYKVKNIRVVKLPSKVRGRYLPKPYVKPARKKFYITFEGKVSIPGFDKLINKK